MSEKTITETMALYHAQHRSTRPFALGVRFYNTRLRQIRREIRKLERQAWWDECWRRGRKAGEQFKTWWKGIK